MYCIEHSDGGIQAAAESIRRELEGKHGATVRKALDVLSRRFTTDPHTEGYRKDGPVAVAKFELGEDDADPAQRESRLLRQRIASELIESLLAKIHAPATPPS